MNVEVGVIKVGKELPWIGRIRIDDQENRLRFCIFKRLDVHVRRDPCPPTHAVLSSVIEDGILRDEVKERRVLKFEAPNPRRT